MQSIASDPCVFGNIKNQLYHDNLSCCLYRQDSQSSSEEEKEEYKEEQEEDQEEQQSAPVNKRPAPKQARPAESHNDTKKRVDNLPPAQAKPKKEIQKLSKDDIIRRQQEEDELRRQINIPLSMQKKKDPEVIEDEDSSSEEDEIKEKENQGYKPKEQPKPVKYQDNKKLDDMDEIDDLDIDKYIKSGPKETIKLEPPSPPRESRKEEQPTYFTGFTNTAPKKHLQTASTNKPKPVVKLQRKQVDEDGDLLSEWEKRYGRSKPATNEWTANSNNNPEPIQKQPAAPKTKKVKEKQQYVENVLASQPKANGADFEDNWDEEDDGGERDHDSRPKQKVRWFCLIFEQHLYQYF